MMYAFPLAFLCFLEHDEYDEKIVPHTTTGRRYGVCL